MHRKRWTKSKKCNCNEDMLSWKCAVKYINMLDVFLNKGVRVMVFNATFNNISFISWRSVLSMEETTYLPQVIDKLYHIILYRVHRAWLGFELTTLVVTCTDCIGSYKSSYHTITTTAVPIFFINIYIYKTKTI